MPIRCPCCEDANLDDDFLLECFVCPNCDLHMSWGGHELDKSGWRTRQRKKWKLKLAFRQCEDPTFPGQFAVPGDECGECMPCRARKGE